MRAWWRERGGGRKVVQASPVFEEEGAEFGFEGEVMRAPPVWGAEVDGVVDFAGGCGERVGGWCVGEVGAALGEVVEAAEVSRDF